MDLRVTATRDGAVLDWGDGERRTAIGPGGILVKVDGRPVQLLYNGPDQFNLVTPFELTPNTHVRFEIYRDGILTAGVNKWVQSAHIGLFRIGDFSADQLAALNQDGSVNGPDNPAQVGTVIALFGTGFGNLARNLAAVQWTASVGGIDTTIQYLGNAPTLVAGVFQINIAIPMNVGFENTFVAINGPGGGDLGHIYIKR